MAYFSVKVCLLGAAGVGKTCIAVRFVEDLYNANTANTIAASYLQKRVCTDNGTQYQLQLWDTAGQERFQAIAPLYYRGAAVVLIVYDVSKRSTLTSGAVKWVNQLKKNADLNEILLVLVGNKADAERWEVNETEAREYARNIGALYWETSAKTGLNVTELFMDICSSLEESGNKSLTYVAARAHPRERSLTVMSSESDSVDVEPRKSAHCCK